MAQILVTKTGTLTPVDKRKLRTAGVVVIEAEQPSDVRLIQAEGPVLAPDDMLFAAISALAISSSAQSRFSEIVLKLVTEKRAKPPSSPAAGR